MTTIPRFKWCVLTTISMEGLIVPSNYNSPYAIKWNDTLRRYEILNVSKYPYKILRVCSHITSAKNILRKHIQLDLINQRTSP